MKIDNYKTYYNSTGYIPALRQHIGHAPIMCTAGGILIENSAGELLLQKRRDNGKWGIIGGAMEIGESIRETVIREAREEAGITVRDISLFGIYSGEDCFLEYPNGDVCYYTSIIFKTNSFEGSIVNQESEVLEHCFFSKSNLPEDLNEYDRPMIEDWLRGNSEVHVR